MAMNSPCIIKSRSSSFRLRSPSLNSLRLRRVFDVFDKNSDGFITVLELTRALGLLGLEANDDLPNYLESMVQPHIQPGNPGLTFRDFESLHRSLDDIFFGNGALQSRNHEPDIDDHCASEEEAAGGTSSLAASLEVSSSLDREDFESDLSEAFKVFDEDGDGYISARELQVVLEKLGLQEGGEMDSVERMISSVDLNRDGLVDFFEFKNMMRSAVMVRSA